MKSHFADSGSKESTVQVPYGSHKCITEPLFRLQTKRIMPEGLPLRFSQELVSSLN